MLSESSSEGELGQTEHHEVVLIGKKTEVARHESPVLAIRTVDTVDHNAKDVKRCFRMKKATPHINSEKAISFFGAIAE